MTGLTPSELDQLYTSLCEGLTEVGDERTPTVLARLSMLLMHEVGDAPRIAAAISEALRVD